MINILSVKFVYVKSFSYLSLVTVTNDGDRVDSNTSLLLKTIRQVGVHPLREELVSLTRLGLNH